MSKMAQLRECLQTLNLQKAFIETLGWNHPSQPAFDTTVQGRCVHCTRIATIGGFEVIEVSESATPAECEPLTAPKCRGFRATVDSDITKVATSHILVFTDRARNEAVFVIARVRDGKRIVRERSYRSGLPVSPLVAFLAQFEIPYERLDPDGEFEHTEMLALLDQGSATAEKVSRRFYDDLKVKRQKFQPFLKWIADEEKRAWYVTALLNRIMFIYFIQAKGLLGEDVGFLRRKLEESAKRGKDRFYREYFLPLCFHGFGMEPAKRGQYAEVFKDVLYLNGGLFAMHQVESEAGITPETVATGSLPPNLNIPDDEFRKWFTFFDEWRWTLDEDNPDNEGEINPSILGFIFEKYVNQKQMGAYYTKEDITGYICRNTIIPRLFDMLAATGIPVDPLPIGELRPDLDISLGEGIERYIYPAVKTTDTLPTETQREFDARQARFQSILQDFDDGKITTVNDFITYNLDIEKMALDFVLGIRDANVLHAFYFGCLSKITVLDPTCGSGAFLFAALKILNPLYKACLVRMETLGTAGKHGTKGIVDSLSTLRGEFAFVNAVDAQPALLDPDSVRTVDRKDFEEELNRIAEHPNRPYYITKTIVVKNLYGVDIMEEAVEMCKLRLFLKLVSYAEPEPSKPNHGIEPLPDIDFNILAGNTLVGYTTRESVREALEYDGGQKRLVSSEEDTRLREIERKADLVDMLYIRFSEAQLEQTPDSGAYRRKMKEAITTGLEPLRQELDDLLAGQYGKSKKKDLDEWRASHHPFHWFVDFHGTIKRGGFDVVVGNPPYVEYSKVSDKYTVLGYRTESCGNLYAFVIERNESLLTRNGRSGMIVPHSAICTDRMAEVGKILARPDASTWLSTYSIRPAKLFDGVDQRLCIYVQKGQSPEFDLFSTRYNRWNEEFRSYLLFSLQYVDIRRMEYTNSLPKLESDVDSAIWRRIHLLKPLVYNLGATFGSEVFFHNAPRYWIRAMDFAPYFWNERDGEQVSTQVKCFRMPSEKDAAVTIAALNSSLFYWWFIALSDCRHLNMREIERFPLGIGTMREAVKSKLVKLTDALMEDLEKHKFRKECVYKTTGKVVYDEYYPKHSKPIIDEIDRVLAEHYGFTDEELDFIINYDIKYRMGGGEN